MLAFTRRRFASILASTAVTAPAASLAAPPLPVEADPIFAAIERHRAAKEAFEAVCDCIDEVKAEAEGREVTDADHEVYFAADDAELRAADALMRTVPQTKAGAQAWLEYLNAASARGWRVYHRLVFEALLKSPVLAA